MMWQWDNLSCGFIDSTCSSPGHPELTMCAPTSGTLGQQDPGQQTFLTSRATWNTTEIETSTNSVKIQQKGSWKCKRRGKIYLMKVCKGDSFVSGLVAISSTLTGHRANKNGYLLSVLEHRLSDLCRTNIFALCDF